MDEQKPSVIKFPAGSRSEAARRVGELNGFRHGEPPKGFELLP
jgi:hypothetical protein